MLHVHLEPVEPLADRFPPNHAPEHHGVTSHPLSSFNAQRRGIGRATSDLLLFSPCLYRLAHREGMQ